MVWHSLVIHGYQNEMPDLSHKIKIAMDESRMLILGASVLLGFQFRSPFETGFASLPLSSQYLKLAGLGILLVSIVLIMSPGAYHRIVWRGNDSDDVHEFSTTVMDLALFPFLIAMGIDFYIIVGKFSGVTKGLLTGVLMGATAFALWYGPALIWRRKTSGSQKQDKKTAKTQKTPLKDRVEQVLTEARVVLPGVQALLGFQLATMLMDGFDKLPLSSKYIHLISLILMGLCVILLMTPAAYHRIVERGEDTESFHRFASWSLLVVMIPLPLGICGDLFVVLRKVTGSISISIGIAALILACFYAVWFGFPLYRKSQLAPDEAS
ncbi:MAG: hypothetical protein QOG23_2451 [Blastocatellia bacterium]|nr:hypothetical protein [Blastocatellia bacterium]